MTQFFIGSEIAGDAQTLEGILGLVVKRAAGALRHLGAVELDQDFLDGGCGRSHRMGDVGVADIADAADGTIMFI